MVSIGEIERPRTLGESLECITLLSDVRDGAHTWYPRSYFREDLDTCFVHTSLFSDIAFPVAYRLFTVSCV